MADNTICPKCQRPIEIGSWPFCPHEKTGTVMIERDEIPGGITLDNYSRDPVTFYSHSERRKFMKENDLREKEKFCPMPGTDIDPAGIPNPKGYVDAKTLENGAVLLTRRKGEPWDGVKAGVLRDITVETIGTREELDRALGYVRPDPAAARRERDTP